MKAYYHPYDYKGRFGIKSPCNSKTHFQIFFHTYSIGIHESGNQNKPPTEIIYWNDRIAKIRYLDAEVLLGINKR